MAYMSNSPLAERMRPQTIDEVLGQDDLIAPGKVLRTAIEKDQVPSMIFWGPPGSGKTTLARIIAKMTGAEFVQLSAVASGIKDMREIIERAQQLKRLNGKTILFVDEIHRYNKTQQDTLLPYVENGTIILIGATTENPSFEINSALLSRARVFVLKLLEPKYIKILLENALKDEQRGLGEINVKVSDEILDFLSNTSNGDARSALNTLELAIQTAQQANGKTPKLSIELVKEALQKSHLLYDKGGEEHYNIISALHKSMRGGDADAALYWLGRMLEGGEDPLYIARRIVRFASEDIGIANSLALPQAVAAFQACQYIGMPECGVVLAQAVAYMAKSKKSNALYTAYLSIQEEIRNNPNDPVPLHIRNAPTKLMKNLGYGKDYKYTPDFKNADEAQQDYLPERLKGRKFLNDI